MSQAPHHAESTGNETVLYMALELSASRWQLAFGLGLATPSRRRTIPAGDETALRRELTAARQRFGLAATAPVRSCYEAGQIGRASCRERGWIWVVAGPVTTTGI